MGESADNGPDNMLLTEQGVVNIDLTGFRYEREKAFNTSLGWKETLTTTDESILLERLFDSSVFKSRYIDNSQNIEDNLKATIHQTIVEVLTEKVQPLVVEEIAQLRSWLAGLDLAYINGNLKQTIHVLRAMESRRRWRGDCGRQRCFFIYRVTKVRLPEEKVCSQRSE